MIANPNNIKNPVIKGLSMSRNQQVAWSKSVEGAVQSNSVEVIA